MGLFQDILQNIQERLKVSAYDYEKLASLLTVALHLPISKDQIIVKGSTLFIKASPVLSHEIQLKKVRLLEILKEHSFSFLDIRITIQ